MKKIIVTLSILSFTIRSYGAGGVNPVPPSEVSCEGIAGKYGKLFDEVYKPNAGIFADEMKDGTGSWMYWDRLEQAFHAADSKALTALFTGSNRLTREDVGLISHMINSGDYKGLGLKEKPSVNTQKFFEDLEVFLQDKPDLLDGKDDQVYRFLKALKEQDHKAGFSSAADDAARTTVAGIGATEKVLLKQAIEESQGIKNASSKWYDGLLKYVSPLNKKAKSMLEFTNRLRQKTQSSYMSVEPLEDAIAKYGSILTEGEINKIKALIVATGDDLAKVRKTVEEVFGKQLTSSDPTKLGEARFRELIKKIEKTKLPSDTEISKAAEKRIDELDAILNEARKRAGLGERPMNEYHPAQLQIRHTQYVRETGNMSSQYTQELNKIVPDSDYAAQAQWTVTYSYSRKVKRTRPKVGGKSGETEEYDHNETTTDIETKTESFRQNASYAEVLNNDYSPSVTSSMLPSSTAPYKPGWGIGSASNSSPTVTGWDTDRTNEISRKAAQAAKIEIPLMTEVRDQIVAVHEIRKNYESLRTDAAARSKAVKDLKDSRAVIIRKANETLETYANMSDSEIRKIWESENPQVFRERNRLLLHRFRHLANTIQHFAEQVERNVDFLELNFDFPDYSKEIAELDRIAKKNFKTAAIAVGVPSAIGAGVGGYYIYDHHKKSQSYYPLEQVGVLQQKFKVASELVDDSYLNRK